MFLTELEVLRKGVEKGVTLEKDTNKRSGITLTNYKIKYIMKGFKSLQNRRILLKGTTAKVTSQERRILNFLRTFMIAGLLFDLIWFTNEKCANFIR